jgi:hypothetical protein
MSASNSGAEARPADEPGGRRSSGAQTDPTASAMVDSAIGAPPRALRVGMQIAGLPAEQREAALTKAEQSPMKTRQEFGATGPQLGAFVKLWMQAITHFVIEIEESGSPQGRNP